MCACVHVYTSSSLPELDPELLECAAADTGVGLGRLAWDFFSPCEAGEKQQDSTDMLVTVVVSECSFAPPYNREGPIANHYCIHLQNVLRTELILFFVAQSTDP